MRNPALLRHVYLVQRAVGAGRANRRDDVMLVQFFLKAISHRQDTKSGESYKPPGEPELAVDGVCGSHTIAYIRHFQRVLRRAIPGSFYEPWEDGVVDAPALDVYV